MIPNRWLSVSRSRRPQLDPTEAVGKSPSASGSRDMRQKAYTPAGRRLRWGRSTDADGDGDRRADFLLHTLEPANRLDKTLSIDGGRAGKVAKRPEAPARPVPGWRFALGRKWRFQGGPTAPLPSKVTWPESHKSLVDNRLKSAEAQRRRGLCQPARKFDKVGKVTISNSSWTGLCLISLGPIWVPSAASS